MACFLSLFPSLSSFMLSVIFVFLYTSVPRDGCGQHPWHLLTECSLQLQDVWRGYLPP
ncbi:hypothetical protein M404DRAFT_26086 [Pisolithus tinctorius Marx 270]|uniref:Uncharacterized protein n=1 Tax=Pisolithus tinctorius Marx 270 TaxID=870435 RepID=A0A0C3J6G5_PISTI|nr:hypothetical protein M404DRAFT_26086 [Pisolithus tinctorius Marx 270]